MPEDQPLRNITVEHHRKSSVKLPEFTLQNVLIVILVLVIGGLGIYIWKPELFKAISKGQVPDVKEQKSDSKSSGYSAVFLTNNQVYFGKLSDENSNYPRLRDVYYLRVDRQLQPPPATESAQPEVSLIKLGNELHGPLDEIRFNRQQILFIEDLKTDGRVHKAIEEFKNRNR